MRVVLVGSPARRSRLRRQLPNGVDVIAECDTIAAAREHAADALLVAIGGSGIDPPLVEALTAREMQVLGLLADGLSNKAIAAHLAISDETVKFHLAAIFGKLGAANRTEAVRTAFRRGLVPI